MTPAPCSSLLSLLGVLAYTARTYRLSALERLMADSARDPPTILDVYLLECDIGQHRWNRFRGPWHVAAVLGAPGMRPLRQC
jgi:hypothetical protein